MEVYRNIIIWSMWTAAITKDSNANNFATTNHTWCWEGLGAGGEGDDRGWDGWMASLTRWMWVCVNSGSWWWTGRPGILRFMGLQRVRHDWATELNWTEYFLVFACLFYSVYISFQNCYNMVSLFMFYISSIEIFFLGGKNSGWNAWIQNLSLEISKSK